MSSKYMLMGFFNFLLMIRMFHKIRKSSYIMSTLGDVDDAAQGIASAVLSDLKKNVCAKKIFLLW